MRLAWSSCGMARPRRIDPVVVQRAQMTAAGTTSVESLRQCQAVLLPVLFGAPLEQTAAVFLAGRATVPRLQAAFRQQSAAGASPVRNWGGRRNSLFTQPEETAFLKPWLEGAAPAIWWWFPRCGPRWRNVWADPSNPRWPTACWHVTVGEKWHLTRASPRLSLRFRRRGKKTPRNAGSPADQGGGPGASRSFDVST